MSKLKKLQSALATMNNERAQVAGAGWFLQDCWLVQVKPGGTARTNCKYWQVRSRQPLFGGKKLKHLKPAQVEDYKAAIARGRNLKQIDRQIEKLQQQLAQLTPTAETTSSSLTTATPLETPLQIEILPTFDCQQPMVEQPRNEVEFTNLAEQERLVQEVLAKTEALRRSLRQATALNSKLRAKTIVRMPSQRVSSIDWVTSARSELSE